MPVRVGVSIGDTLAALHGVIGVMTALYHRKVNGGAGQVIDVALHEAVFNVHGKPDPRVQRLGAVRERAGSALPGIAPSNAYPCQDGWVLVAGNGDSIFKRLMDGHRPSGPGRLRPIWPTTPAACRAWPRSMPPLAPGRRQRSVQTVMDELGAARVPARQGLHGQDIAEDPHYQAREMLLTQRSPRWSSAAGARRGAQAFGLRRAQCAAAPPTWATTPMPCWPRSGLSAEQIAQLRAKGIVQ